MPLQSFRQGKLVKTIGFNQPQASDGPLVCPLPWRAKLLSIASCCLPLDPPLLSLCPHPSLPPDLCPADPSARNGFPTPEGTQPPILQARASPPLLFPSPGAPEDFRFSVLACLPSPSGPPLRGPWGLGWCQRRVPLGGDRFSLSHGGQGQSTWCVSRQQGQEWEGSFQMAPCLMVPP